jgi:hypothetical protein
VNLAFQALLLLLLILPGVLFQYAYYHGKLSTEVSLPFTFPAITGRTIKGLAFAGVLHLLWLLVWTQALCLPANLENVLYFLIGSHSDPKLFARILDETASSAGLISTYFVVLYVISGLSGITASLFVRWAGWDRKYPFFRFDNEWNYLFTGEVREFTADPGTLAPISGTFLSVVLEIGGTAYLYVGILDDYYLDRTGSLDRFLLRKAVRREFSEDRLLLDEPSGGDAADAGPVDLEPERFYPIDGDYFVVKYADIKNLNIKYLYVDPVR